MWLKAVSETQAKGLESLRYKQGKKKTFKLYSSKLQITVTDENGQRYEFPCKEWLSETQGGGKTERLLRLQHT